MARRKDEHPPYQECPDEGCPRFPCRVYKEGFRAGYQRGYQAGETEGYAAGYAAALAACHALRAAR